MTTAIGVFCLLVFGLPAASAEQIRPPTIARQFRITGTVVNATSGQPLADTLVEIGVAQKQDAVESVETDASGRFVFERLAPAKYWLVGERQGFLRQGYNEHSNFFTAIVVGSGLQSEDLVFRLRADASISGTVTDDQNEAIREAQVYLFSDSSEEGERRASQRAQTGTDSQGHYRFSHLRPGKYFVAVSAQPWYRQPQQPQVSASPTGGGDSAGSDPAQVESSAKPSPLDVAYPLTYYADAVEADHATPVVLKPGDRLQTDITLSAVPAVHLRILTAGMSSSPDSGMGANVSLRALGGVTIPVPVSNMNSAGAMEIAGLAPGDYMLNLTSFGKERHNWTQNVRLTTDAEIDGRRSSSSSITGVVTLDGVPPSGKAYIALRDETSGTGLGAQIGTKGEFEFQSQPVRAGTYQVAVFNVPGAAVTAVMASGARVNGESVTIADNSNVKLVVSMSKGLGRVDGVAERDGSPLAGAMVVLVPDQIEGNESLFRRDQSDSDGSFSLPNIVPGRYTVVALGRGWELEWGKAEVLRPYLTNGERMEISPRGKYQVTVKVQ